MYHFVLKTGVNKITKDNVFDFLKFKEHRENKEEIEKDEIANQEVYNEAFQESKDFALFWGIEILKIWQEEGMDLRSSPLASYTISLMMESIISSRMAWHGYDTQLLEVSQSFIPIDNPESFINDLYEKMDDIYQQNDNESIDNE